LSTYSSRQKPRFLPAQKDPGSARPMPRPEGR
jgi:hypothetical protein